MKKYETLHVSSNAKDIVYAERKRGETYSDTIIRVFSHYRKGGDTK